MDVVGILWGSQKVSVVIDDLAWLKCFEKCRVVLEDTMVSGIYEIHPRVSV